MPNLKGVYFTITKLIQTLHTLYSHKQAITKSRHMIVCRAAKNAGAPHCEYINRK